MVVCPNDLAKRYQEGKVVLFVGAGVTMSVKWKSPEGKERRGISWEELVNQAAVLLGYDDPRLLRCRGTELQILEYFRLENSDEPAKLMNWLSSNLKPSDEDLRTSQIHTEIAKCEKCKIIYTTNYDDFIERSLGINGRSCSRIAVEKDMGISGETTQVVKFHGDFDNPSHIVMNESDYHRRLSLSTPLDIKLRADLLGRVALFIGYSFRDPNVSYLFRIFTDTLKDHKQILKGDRAYITVPDPSDFENTLFKSREIEPIALSRQSMTEDISDLLRKIRGE